ncbi:ATP-binding protein [Haliea sp. E17]|uniref:ATP-binding protein n=1 Tax=Haliea sp. E17 TaxID=3401576 RepID=UPI003AAF3979
MTTSYPRSLDSLESIVADTARSFTENGIDASLLHTVDLVIEELFVNMVKYNRGATRDIALDIRQIDSGVEVSLTDFDVERFDPSQPVEVDIYAPATERDAGGLGLYLIHKMVDSIKYEYYDRQSKVTITKRVCPADV